MRSSGCRCWRRSPTARRVTSCGARPWTWGGCGTHTCWPPSPTAWTARPSPAGCSGTGWPPHRRGRRPGDRQERREIMLSTFSCRQITKVVWLKHFPQEPFDLDESKGKSPREFPNGLVSKIGYNIEEAALRQRDFYYQVRFLTRMRVRWDYTEQSEWNCNKIKCFIEEVVQFHLFQIVKPSAVLVFWKYNFEVEVKQPRYNRNSLGFLREIKCVRCHCPTTATKSSTWTASGGTRCISTSRGRTPRPSLFPATTLTLSGTPTRSTHRSTRPTCRPSWASSSSTTTRWTTGRRAPNWTRQTRSHGSSGWRSSRSPSPGRAPCSGGSRHRASSSPSAATSSGVCWPWGRWTWRCPASRSQSCPGCRRRVSSSQSSSRRMRRGRKWTRRKNKNCTTTSTISQVRSLPDILIKIFL